MKKENDIVEIHIKTKKSTENCNLIMKGEGIDLVSLVVSAMPYDDTFRQVIEMANRMYNIFNEKKPEILDHKN
jgi:hypothetical protein